MKETFGIEKTTSSIPLATIGNDLIRLGYKVFYATAPVVMYEDETVAMQAINYDDAYSFVPNDTKTVILYTVSDENGEIAPETNYIQNVKKIRCAFLNNFTDYQEICNKLNDEIHGQNVVAGWWTALKAVPAIEVGDSILEFRNRGELMILVVSEVSEADHGYLENINDDKLPHLPMLHVELADVAIRLFDMLGAENAFNKNTIDFDYNASVDKFVTQLNGKSHERHLLTIVNCVSAAMEHIRKSRVAEYRHKLAEALTCTFAVAKLNDFDVLDVIEQKRNFNANRADHKIENRAKENGKIF